jgi:hypothetical protein
MRSPRHSDSDASLLQDVIGCGRPVLLVVQVSHRRWYGLNGVQALVLTDQTLYRVRAGRYILRPVVVLDKFLLTDLTDARWTPRGTRGAGRISFRLAGRCQSYASKWAETAELAQALTALQAAEQPQNGSSLATTADPGHPA